MQTNSNNVSSISSTSRAPPPTAADIVEAASTSIGLSEQQINNIKTAVESVDSGNGGSAMESTISAAENIAVDQPVDLCLAGEAVLKAVSDSTPTAALSSSSSASSFTAESASDGTASSSTGGVKKNRCHMCKKRVGLTGFVCRCGGLYCGEHRYDKAHNCAFDYKAMEREEIRKNNPLVVSEKIQRIWEETCAIYQFDTCSTFLSFM